MPEEFLTNGPIRGSRPKYMQIFTNLKLLNKTHITTREPRLLPEISVPHWITLGGQSNSMALETPGTFFSFFLKEVVPVSPES